MGGRLRWTDLATSHHGWPPMCRRRPCAWVLVRQRRPDTAAEIRRRRRSPGRHSGRRRSRSKGTQVTPRADFLAADALPTMIYSQRLLLPDVQHLSPSPAITSIYTRNKHVVDQSSNHILYHTPYICTWTI